MWVKQSAIFTTKMTGNGNHTTYQNGDDWGMVYIGLSLFYPH